MKFSKESNIFLIISIIVITGTIIPTIAYGITSDCNRFVWHIFHVKQLINCLENRIDLIENNVNNIILEEDFELSSVYSSGNSLTLNNVTNGETFIISVKGDLATVLSTSTISLRINNIIVDSVNSGQIIATIPFSLSYKHIAINDNDISITVTSTSGTLNRIKIMVLRY